MSNFIQKKNSDSSESGFGKVYSNIVVFFMLVILGIFPLYYRNFYFDILVAKYEFYYRTILCMAGVLALSMLIRFFIGKGKADGDGKTKVLKPVSSYLKGKWNAADFFLILFVIFTVISTMESEYVYEAFWGNEGRYSGLFLMLIYAASVFMISKFARVRKWHLDVFLFASILVCLFGITDYFMMDILHWKMYVDGAQKNSFTSTLGNINTYTAYIAVMLGVSASLFAAEKNIFRTFWYLTATVIGFAAIITGQSDNAYLAMGALFGVLPIFLFASRRGFKRYFVLVGLFFTAIKWIAEMNEKMQGKVIGLGGFFKVIAEYGKLSEIVIAVWGFVAVLYMLDLIFLRKKEDSLGKLGIAFCVLWGIGLLTALAGVAYALYDVNIAGNVEKYGKFREYLLFSDNWGTNRGYCWRIGWESYMKLPLKRKLLGFGADTYGILTWDYRAESASLHHVFYESAHNEYLQYLVTIGPFALVSYVAFLVSACVTMVRHLKDKPFALAPAMAVLCYAAQAVVNINLPIATPLMWTMIGFGLAAVRKNVPLKEERKTAHKIKWTKEAEKTTETGQSDEADKLKETEIPDEVEEIKRTEIPGEIEETKRTEIPDGLEIIKEAEWTDETETKQV